METAQDAGVETARHENISVIKWVSGHFAPETFRPRTFDDSSHEILPHKNMYI